MVSDKRIRECNIAATIAATSQFHKERRDYMRHSLQHLLCFDTADLSSITNILVCHITDQVFYYNSLIKNQTLLCTVSIAKNEILWYFYHCDGDVTSKKPMISQLKSSIKTAKQDLSIFELVFLHYELVQRLDRHKSSEYLAMTGCRYLINLQKRSYHQ